MKAYLKLSINEDTISRASDWLEDIADHWGWPQRTKFKLRLSLDETLTNIMMYGYTDARQAYEAPCIELQLQQDGRLIVLDIKDNGVAFDPTARESRDLDTSLDEAEMGGHGLRLIRHYLQDIRYVRRNGWNHLTLSAQLDEI